PPCCLRSHLRAWGSTVAELLVSLEGIEVWHGDSLDVNDVAEVMGDRCADLFVADAPYSERTHSGHRAGKVTADRASGFAVAPTPAKGNRKAVATYAAKVAGGLKERSDIDYEPWSLAEVERLCLTWVDRAHGWWTSITDHVLSEA